MEESYLSFSPLLRVESPVVSDHPLPSVMAPVDEPEGGAGGVATQSAVDVSSAAAGNLPVGTMGGGSGDASASEGQQGSGAAVLTTLIQQLQQLAASGDPNVIALLSQALDAPAGATRVSFGVQPGAPAVPVPSIPSVPQVQPSVPASVGGLGFTTPPPVRPPLFGGTDGGNGGSAPPKFGGLDRDNCVWVGGPPLADWSGTFHKTKHSPYCLRDLAARYEVGLYAARIGTSKDPLKLFKKDDPTYSLLDFARHVRDHMLQHGMDTVFYLQGVDASGEGGLDLFTSYSQFEPATIKAWTDKMIEHKIFDSYAIDCLQESGLWLLSQLDTSLKTKLRSVCDSRPYGPYLWMAVTSECQASVVSRAASLEKKFKDLKLSQFRGENVEEYCVKAEELLTDLSNLGKLPDNHLTTIVDCLSGCSVQDFSSVFFHMRPEVARQQRIKAQTSLSATKLTSSPFPDATTILSTANETVTFVSLLREAKDLYQDLVTEGKWGATNPQARLAQSLQAMKAKVDELSKQSITIKATPGSPPPSGPPKVQEWTLTGKGRNPPWRYQNPSGGPKTRTWNGKELHWCGKCNNIKGMWTSHSTADHKGKTDDGKPGGGAKDYSKYKCHGCNQIGHIKANCPNKQEGPPTETTTVTNPHATLAAVPCLAISTSWGSME